ncbi:hypothetical protein H9P43_004213 [Blastocladiella emersonii ATCC 22665]|nr:hypothetical protein H9P43_004213 [Blastocladiella emersonii ATCC 22665]
MLCWRLRRGAQPINQFGGSIKTDGCLARVLVYRDGIRPHDHAPSTSPIASLRDPDLVHCALAGPLVQPAVALYDPPLVFSPRPPPRVVRRRGAGKNLHDGPIPIGEDKTKAVSIDPGANSPIKAFSDVNQAAALHADPPPPPPAAAPADGAFGEGALPVGAPAEPLAGALGPLRESLLKVAQTKEGLDHRFDGISYAFHHKVGARLKVRRSRKSLQTNVVAEAATLLESDRPRLGRLNFNTHQRRQKMFGKLNESLKCVVVLLSHWLRYGRGIRVPRRGSVVEMVDKLLRRGTEILRVSQRFSYAIEVGAAKCIRHLHANVSFGMPAQVLAEALNSGNPLIVRNLILALIDRDIKHGVLPQALDSDDDEFSDEQSDFSMGETLKHTAYVPLALSSYVLNGNQLEPDMIRVIIEVIPPKLLLAPNVRDGAVIVSGLNDVDSEPLLRMLADHPGGGKRGECLYVFSQARNQTLEDTIVANAHRKYMVEINETRVAFAWNMLLESQDPDLATAAKPWRFPQVVRRKLIQRIQNNVRRESGCSDRRTDLLELSNRLQRVVRKFQHEGLMDPSFKLEYSPPKPRYGGTFFTVTMTTLQEMMRFPKDRAPRATEEEIRVLFGKNPPAELKSHIEAIKKARKQKQALSPEEAEVAAAVDKIAIMDAKASWDQQLQIASLLFKPRFLWRCEGLNKRYRNWYTGTLKTDGYALHMLMYSGGISVKNSKSPFGRPPKAAAEATTTAAEQQQQQQAAAAAAGAEAEEVENTMLDEVAALDPVTREMVEDVANAIFGGDGEDDDDDDDEEEEEEGDAGDEAGGGSGDFMGFNVRKAVKEFGIKNELIRVARGKYLVGIDPGVNNFISLIILEFVFARSLVHRRRATHGDSPAPLSEADKLAFKEEVLKVITHPKGLGEYRYLQISTRRFQGQTGGTQAKADEERVRAEKNLDPVYAKMSEAAKSKDKIAMTQTNTKYFEPVYTTQNRLARKRRHFNQLSRRQQWWSNIANMLRDAVVLIGHANEFGHIKAKSKAPVKEFIREMRKRKVDIHIVNEAYTSKRCCACAAVAPDNGKNGSCDLGTDPHQPGKTWAKKVCRRCCHALNRDRNAALNIALPQSVLLAKQLVILKSFKEPIEIAKCVFLVSLRARFRVPQAPSRRVPWVPWQYTKDQVSRAVMAAMVPARGATTTTASSSSSSRSNNNEQATAMDVDAAARESPEARVYEHARARGHRGRRGRGKGGKGDN